MAMYFDEIEAKEYGVNEAILIQNLRFWINKNKANNKHFYEGRYWTYNSTEAFRKLFIFWSSSQIRRIIDSLVKKNIVLVGNFNKMKYDRTKWFAFNDENKWLKGAENSICQNRQMDLMKSSNGFDEIVKPIPDINTDINTDYLSGKKSEKIKKEQLEEEFEKFWKLYPRKVAKGKARESYSKAVTKTTSDVILKGVENYLKEINFKKTEEKFIAHPTTWLNQERWEDEYDLGCNQKNFSSSPSRSAKPLSDYPDYLYGEDGKLKELNEMSFEELKVYYEISDKRMSGN